MGLKIFNKLISSYKACRLNSSKAKGVIKAAIAKDITIARPFEDVGSFYSARQFFRMKPRHYSVFEGKNYSGIAFGENYSHYAAVNYDKSKNFATLRLYDCKTNEVSIYDKLGQLINKYSPDETAAIQYYKRDSKNIHKYLRYNEPVKNEAEVAKNVKIISDLFKGNAKTSTMKEDSIVYRALDSKALKEILSMPQDGMIYTEPSFLSVATKKRSTYQFLNFKNFNHKLKLRVKEGTKYLDMDNISAGRIVQPQMLENELVLDKGSKILITNRHGKGGYIEAELLV